LFPDVSACIGSLRAAGLVVGAVTDGNAHVSRDQVVAPLFDFSICAEEAGATKEGLAPHLMAAAEAGCHPSQVLFIARWHIRHKSSHTYLSLPCTACRPEANPLSTPCATGRSHRRLNFQRSYWSPPMWLSGGEQTIIVGMPLDVSQSPWNVRRSNDPVKCSDLRVWSM